MYSGPLRVRKLIKRPIVNNALPWPTIVEKPRLGLDLIIEVCHALEPCFCKGRHPKALLPTAFAALVLSLACAANSHPGDV